MTLKATRSCHLILKRTMKSILNISRCRSNSCFKRCRLKNSKRACLNLAKRRFSSCSRCSNLLQMKILSHRWRMGSLCNKSRSKSTMRHNILIISVINSNKCTKYCKCSNIMQAMKLKAFRSNRAKSNNKTKTKRMYSDHLKYMCK